MDNQFLSILGTFFLFFFKIWFSFKCAFETTATTDAQEVTVSVTSLGDQEIEQSGLKWENVQMKFYSDSRFESEVQSSEVHQIGDYINTEVSWNIGVSTNFPVSLYLKECSAQG